MPEFYQVGGCVRDEQLGFQSKDIDYVVTGFSSYENLGKFLTSQGYRIVDRYEEKYTYRAQAPNGEWADFVFARKDGKYVNGDMLSCAPGSLDDDLARRDFTINAIAKNDVGQLYDPHNGLRDLENRVLRCVGDPKLRFTEDPRRLTRGIRFMVKYGLTMEKETLLCYSNPLCILNLGHIKY